MGLPTDLTIISLDSSHLSGIEILLRECDLPFEDCSEHLDHFFGVTEGDKLVATGALQIHGSIGLLRSIAVSLENRGLGLAAEMTKYLLDLAGSNKIKTLYLLTETAQDYFARFGFSPVDRDGIPAEIKSTRQFVSLCPTSAQVMRLYL
jgi:amino-acid N-acetyltransferase